MILLYVFTGMFLLLLLVWTFVLLALYRAGLQILSIVGRYLSTLEISDIFMKAVGIAEHEYSLDPEKTDNRKLKREQDKKLIITDVLLQHGYNPRDFNIDGLLSWANDEYKKQRG